MEKLLNICKLDHTRIKAIDGNNKEEMEICIKSNDLENGANACMCSHLKALRYFLEETIEDKIIIFEDDVSFEFLKYIPYNWTELEKQFPKDYDVIQLSYSTFDKKLIYPFLIKKNIQNLCDYDGTIAYLISRKTAQILIDKFYKNNKYDLSIMYYPAADRIIVKMPNTYVIPIFSFDAIESTIHNDYIDYHRKTKNDQLEVWKKYDLIDYFPIKFS